MEYHFKSHLLKQEVATVSKHFNGKSIMENSKAVKFSYLPQPFSEIQFQSDDSIEGHKSFANGRELHEKNGKPNDYSPFLKNIIELIYTKIGDADFGVLDIADFANLSDRQLTRVIKKESGLTPAKLIREIRLHYAKFLLEHRLVRRVNEVSQEIGISKSSHFSHLYYSRFGVKPSEYLVS